MKILMLVNWKIQRCTNPPKDKQPPDFYTQNQPYWFFRYFDKRVDVDILDVTHVSMIENIERYKLHFHVTQGVKALRKLNQYDLVVSHGMPSAVVVAIWRKFFKTKAKHVVFDIGCMNSAARTGTTMKLMQWASKSIDFIIYHTYKQKDYYREYYPWLEIKCQFVRFGTDLDFFSTDLLEKRDDFQDYIICIGASKRDWDTLVGAYIKSGCGKKLYIVGHVSPKYEGIVGVKQYPHVPVNEMINLIYNSYMCVLPLESFDYSYGQMTLLQQMALGKCVITADVPSFEQYFSENVILKYHSKNVDELADIISYCVDNPEYTVEMGQKAKDYLQLNLNEKTMSKEIEKVFTEVAFDE